jgi:hypothetical protein
MKTHRAVAAGLLALGSLFLGGCGVETSALPNSEPAAPVGEPTSVGYEGWWNSTPVSGDASGLPDETVAVRTDTGQIVDASKRDTSGRAEAVEPGDIDYKVVEDPSWPPHSVVIIDTATNEVIESFAVDSAGNPTS